MERKYVVRNLLDAFLLRFKARYDEWEKGDRSFVTLDQRLWNRGIWSSFGLDGREIMAKPLAVNEKGQIVVEQKDGRIQAFGTERLRHIRH